MNEFSKYLDLVEGLAKSTLDIVNKFRNDMPVGNSRSKRTYKFEYVESILRNAGRPLHVNEIIEIAKRDYKATISKDSLSSAISKKIRAGSNIVRTAPNTFQIKEV